MIKRSPASFFLLPLALLSCVHKPYTSKDLTAENLFTSGIEGPRCDGSGNLFAVNYKTNGTIGLVREDGTNELFVTLPEGSTANSIELDKEGNLLLADYTGHNILKVDRQTKEVTIHAHHDGFNQPNDITINKKGQLFASDPNWKDGTGKLWRIDEDGSVTLLAELMGTTNGITLSPDEKILYVNESVQLKLWAFDLDDAGAIHNKTLVHQFEDFGLDGMKCDAEGNLYVTRHGKGTIAILSPGGEILREVAMKGKKPSNIAFGGKDGKTCYITVQDRGCVEMFQSEIAGKDWVR
jgi:gluconolactonase